MGEYCPALKSAQVHVWEADLDALSGESESTDISSLSADEAARARKIRVAETRRRYVACRRALRRILGRYLDVDPARVEFAYGPWGKPVLASPAAPLHFNVSHAEGFALIAVTRAGSVGVDLERIRYVPEWESIAGTLFTAGDLSRIQETIPEKRTLAFIDSWTRREAQLKQIGCGWSGRPALRDNASVSATCPIAAPPEYLAALAVSEPGCEIVRLTDPI